MNGTSAGQEPGEAALQRADDLPCLPLGELLLVLSLEAQRYFSLNQVGARIWELLEQPVTLSVIVARLMAEYAVSEEVCAREAGELVAALLELKLVTQVLAAGPSCG